MPACACAACVEACREVPGCFKPGEAERAAELLGMPWTEFRNRFLILESWDPDEDSGDERVFFWSPRKVGVDEDRRVAGWIKDWIEYGPCVFLNAKDLCAIHARKPWECRKALSCRPSLSGVEIRRRVMLAWKAAGNPLKSLPGKVPW